MAPADRPPTQHLSFLREAAPVAGRWGLFALLRRLEALAPHLPRIGRSRLPTQNVVDLEQVPSLGFAPRTVERIEVARGRAAVSGYWPGLLGPMGALPTHMTEYAYYEARYAKSRPFGRFLALVSGRLHQLFYRAWANSQPATMLDRPGDDAFAGYLAYLSGAQLGADPYSAFPPAARLHYAGLFASRRSAIGIQDGLTHLLHQPLQVLEYQPRWQSIEPADRTRLGRSYCQLGTDAVLGSRVRTITDAFRVVIRAGSLADYQTLMPDGRRFALTAEALDAFAPDHLEWDIAVEIAQTDAPPARLGRCGRLGWDSWVGTGSPQTIRRDAHLRRSARQPIHTSTRGLEQ